MSTTRAPISPTPINIATNPVEPQSGLIVQLGAPPYRMESGAVYL